MQKQPRLRRIIDQYLAVKPQQTGALKPVLAYLGACRPVELGHHRVFEYIQARRLGGLAPGTVRKELAALVTVIKWAQGRLLLQGDVPKIDLPPAPPPKDLWLDEMQEDHFLMLSEQWRGPQSRIHRFVAIALDTAARRNAIEKLTWDRVDLSGGKIDFRVPGVAPTKKRNAVVPIADRLYPVLEDALRLRTPNPCVIGQGDIKKAFHRFAQTTPYPWVTPHVLRHTWGTLAARRGVDLWKIAGVMGDTIMTVEKNYLHHCPDHLRDAVNRDV